MICANHTINPVALPVDLLFIVLGMIRHSCYKTEVWVKTGGLSIVLNLILVPGTDKTKYQSHCIEYIKAKGGLGVLSKESKKFAPGVVNPKVYSIKLIHACLDALKAKMGKKMFCCHQHQ